MITLKSNLEFTLSLEPENKHALRLLEKSKNKDFSISYVSSLKMNII